MIGPIVTAITLAEIAAFVLVVVALRRWVAFLGTRLLLDFQSIREDVVALERNIYRFDLGKVRARTLQQKLDAYSEKRAA